MRPADKGRGFTLVELMIVMLIIGVLMGILVPTIGRAIRTARATKTRRMMQDIELGLKAFKNDFQMYPPSERTGNQYPRTGAEKLVYHLRGPQGLGWGAGAGGRFPDGATGRRSRTYGPYFQTDPEHLEYTQVGGEYQPTAFLDYFTPPGRFIYFKAGRDAAGNIAYSWQDNNAARPDPEAKSNYASQMYFEDCVLIGGGIGGSGQKRYDNNEFLLISPGLDGRFGAIERDAQGAIRPTTREKGSYDDITNWN
jgi:prepilin-type N-terminal cleavage/methylation domain-containing protein